MNKIAVITGASGGLGHSLASEFSSHGWQVIGTGRSNPPTDLPEGAAYQQFDAGDAAASESFWQQLHEQYADAEICLVNNAGGYISGSLIETRPDGFEQQMRSSYFSAVYMTRGLALVIPKARIINIISSSALAAHKKNSAYGAAKAAEMHFFQSIQQEFEPAQYQITNLHPSDIATQGPNPEAMSPEDLAEFVRGLAESQASLYLRDATIYPRVTG